MNRLVSVLLAALGAASALGCGGGALPTSANPERARQALHTALDAWQRGQPPDALRAQTPSIHVADEDWQAGCRLLRYQVADGGQPGAPNLRCAVVLSLQNQRGKAIQKKAVYRVATSPAVSVVREDS